MLLHIFVASLIYTILGILAAIILYTQNSGMFFVAAVIVNDGTGY